MPNDEEERSRPDIIRWSIDGRRKTQITALKLFELIDDHSDSFTAEQEATVRTLTAVAFSLWRAVFLTDRRISRRTTHAKLFLRKMLEENAITFASDRASSAWSFNYYADNAKMRLVELAEQYPQITEAMAGLPGLRNTSRNRWDRFQNGFECAVNLFAANLR